VYFFLGYCPISMHSKPAITTAPDIVFPSDFSFDDYFASVYCSEAPSGTLVGQQVMLFPKKT
jgi:hypothetical protein